MLFARRKLHTFILYKKGGLFPHGHPHTAAIPARPPYAPAAQSAASTIPLVWGIGSGDWGICRSLSARITFTIGFLTKIPLRHSSRHCERSEAILLNRLLPLTLRAMTEACAANHGWSFPEENSQAIRRRRIAAQGIEVEIPQTLRMQSRGIGADSPVLPLGQAAKCAQILIEISF